MEVAITGHRPHKLGGYNEPNPLKNKIHIAITAKLAEITLNHKVALKDIKFICGMAIGVDQWFANIAVTMQAPLIAAVPFLGQEKLWLILLQNHYKQLLNYAASNGEVIIVCEGGYAPEKMQRRNEYMVDRIKKSSGYLIEVWDGSEGGTANCCNYAKNVLNADQILRIDPRNL